MDILEVLMEEDLCSGEFSHHIIHDRQYLSSLIFPFFNLQRAMENGNEKLVRVLKKIGVRDDLKDSKGLTPKDLFKMKKRKNDQEL